MSGARGEEFARKHAGDEPQIEPPFVMRWRLFTIQRPPFMIFGFSPAPPFSIVLHFGWRSVAIGWHIVIARNPKYRG